jgi:sugar-specific transcriptional regulator TrmB
VLRRFDCTGYESKAYMTLLSAGPMVAIDVARYAKIPSARVYDVLQSLELKGLVRKQGIRPAKYDAEHPRSVVTHELQKIQDTAEKALVEAEQTWELRRDPREAALGNCWSVLGYDGFAREVKANVAGSKESILIFDPDLTWVTRRDIDAIRAALGRHVAVNIVSSHRSHEALKDMEEAGIKFKEIEGRNESYYIFDKKRVQVRLHNPDGTVVFDDPATAQILISSFDEAERGRSAAK